MLSWLNILKKNQSPNPCTFFFTKQFFLKDKADEIIEILEKLKRNERVVTILKNLPEEITN
jgi:Cft2 family RNA processing exonuclease